MDMNIVWSALVLSFKKHGKWWYYAAQKLPIDPYKDLLLLFDFLYRFDVISAKDVLISEIQQRYQAYYSRNVSHPIYGATIDMLYRRKVGFDHIKDFLQSDLLYVSRVAYHTEDELKAYICDRGVSISMIIWQILWCAPWWYWYLQALWEWCWIVHMLYDFHKDITGWYYYIPQEILDRFGVSHDDIVWSMRMHRTCWSLQNLVKYYCDIHERLFAYALDGLWYTNPSLHQSILELFASYEHKIWWLRSNNYNIFHPSIQSSVLWAIKAYFIYWLWYLWSRK